MFLPGRLALDMPDALRMKIESEGAQDPFFGVMESHQLPSPYKIQQQQQHHTVAKVDYNNIPTTHLSYVCLLSINICQRIFFQIGLAASEAHKQMETILLCIVNEAK